MWGGGGGGHRVHKSKDLQNEYTTRYAIASVAQSFHNFYTSMNITDHNHVIALRERLSLVLNIVQFK